MSDILQDPQMTVSRFKKDFLGQKPKKKAVVTPFNSIMVSTLHKVAPPLKRADPHQFIASKRARSSCLTARNRNFSRKKYSSTLKPSSTSR